MTPLLTVLVEMSKLHKSRSQEDASFLAKRLKGERSFRYSSNQAEEKMKITVIQPKGDLYFNTLKSFNRLP